MLYGRQGVEEPAFFGGLSAAAGPGLPLEVDFRDLTRIQPDLFALVTPSRALKIETMGDVIDAFALGPNSPAAKTAIMIDGQDRIKSFRLLVPFNVEDGKPVFEEPEEAVSVNGGVHGGPFGSVYCPSEN